METDSLALISVNNDCLRDGFLELESVRRFQFRDDKFTGVQPFTQLVDPDLTSGVREYLAVVDGWRREPRTLRRCWYSGY